MDARLLGPLEVSDRQQPVKLTGGKQSALLALLLLNGGRVLSLDRIVDDLWGDDPPESAQKMVQILVSQLRKVLPQRLIETRAPGYLVDLDGHTLDLREFERLHAVGRDAAAGGRPAEAAATLRQALALWRGSPLAEFEEPFAQLEQARLEEQQLSCLEDAIDAELALGRHAELVPELDALVRRHPLRERSRGQLMLALYRSGRHAEALEAHASFRRMLDDQLGIDPPPRLKELERLILRQDASLDLEQRGDGRARAEGAPPPSPLPARTVVEAAGRERELTHLERLHEEARAGRRALVFVAGDAGIGKTTIVESFLAGAEQAAGTLVTVGQCVEHRGPGEPYLPVLDALGALARQPHGRELVPLLARQAPTWLGQLPWLLGDDELEAVHRRLVGATRERMHREMLEALDAVASDRTLVLVLEDLHWCDPSTVDLLDALARRRGPARLLVVGTYRRSEAAAHEHPVYRLARELRGHGLCAEIAVGPLGRDAVAAYAAGQLGTDPPAAFVDLLHERTAGNPLFVRLLLDSWLERGLVGGDAPELEPLARDVPDSVRELIEQALERLSPADRELAAAASVVGQEFSVAAAGAASELPEPEVDDRFDRLARTGRLVERAGEEAWPDGTSTSRYRFVHALHREVLYESLPAARRGALHARVGSRLADAYRGRAREVAAALADHFLRAGDAARAVPALRLATEQAAERLAHREALGHVTAALDLVERLPEGPERWSEELALQSMLGAAKIATAGWSADEVEAAFLRARDLAERLGSDDGVVQMLFRLGTLYEVRGDYERSQTMIEQTLEHSRAGESGGLLTDSHEVLACSFFHQGSFGDALDHAEQGVAAVDLEHVDPVTAAYGHNPGSACHTWAALSLWFLGYPDRARARAAEAVAFSDHPRRRHGRAAALAHAAIVEQLRLDPAATRAAADAAVAAAAEAGYLYRVAMGSVLRGWAKAADGSWEEGIEELERGLELSRRTGARMDDPYYLALLADARARAGRLDDAWAAVEAGLAHVAPGRRFFFESELHRLAGELLLRLGRPGEAEERLRLAVEVARAQRSPSLVLRAALSLGAHLVAEAKAGPARALVAGAYAGLSEGFDTRDLVAARELLEAVAAEPAAPAP